MTTLFSSPPASVASHPLLARLLPALVRRLGWRTLASAPVAPPELSALAFPRDVLDDARGGALLAPLWWRQGDRVVIGNHRLRLDAPRKRPGRYELPRGAAQKPLASAYGALLEGPAAWSATDRPLLLCEGERRALWLASLLPGHAIAACPGVWTPDDLPPAELWAQHVARDLGALVLRGRPVLLVVDRRDSEGGPSPSPELGRLGELLTRQGARVVPVCPPPDAPPQLGAWLGTLVGRGERAEACAQLEAWLLQAAAPPPRDPAPAAPSPSGTTQRLGDVLPAALRAGPDDLVMPPGYYLQGEPSAPLWAEGHKNRPDTKIASGCFWPIAHVHDPAGRQLELALIVTGEGPRPYVQVGRLRCALLHDSRLLCGELARIGIKISPRAAGEVANYLHAFVDANALPVRVARTGTGWDEAKTTFQLGKTCVGGEALIGMLEEDEATQKMVAALGCAGRAAVWKETAEAMMDAAPATSLVLAAAVASPLLRLFGWPSIGVLFGALGGAGKSTMLRAAASVFGSSGDSGHQQPAGLVGKGTGTSRGLLLQFRNLADLPHLLDELRPHVTDARQREDLADVLHQLYDGEEHIRSTRASNGSKVGRPFPGCTVIAGEVAPGDFLKKGGVIRRFLPPPSPYAVDGLPLGRFHEPLAQNHGHLGTALVEALVKTSPTQRAEMAGRYAAYLEGLAITDQEPEHIRSWARQIATALTAVDVCAQLCPDLVPHPTRWKRSIQAAWAQIVDAEGGQGTGDVLAVIEEKVRGWVARNRWHLLPSRALREKLELRGELTDRERVLLTPKGALLGQVLEASREGEEDEVLGKVDLFQASVTKFLADEGYSEGTFTGALARRGFLETTEAQTKRGGASRNVRIQGAVVRVYRVVLTASAESVGE